MDVPLLLELKLPVFFSAEIMSFPGAKISMHAPKLYTLESFVPIAPTVIAFVAEAGDVVQASTLPFPAATTMTTPAATASFTAVSRLAYTFGALMLRLATAPFGRGRPTTQSIPAITEAKEPSPFSLRTLTEIMLTFLAIPYLVPPTVPGKVKEGKIS
jgi:hypothetical protein